MFLQTADARNTEMVLGILVTAITNDTISIRRECCLLSELGVLLP